MRILDDQADLLGSPSSATPSRAVKKLVADLRAVAHFQPDLIEKEDLAEILRVGSQAPSGFNIQPWRFIVVQDASNRRRLRAVAMDQEKITEAPVVIIAVGMKQEWKRLANQILKRAAESSAGNPAAMRDARTRALQFLSTQSIEVWVNRQTMVAFTTMMLAAEALGYDTAPMEGFDSAAVKREFGIPQEAEVIALLAIGKAQIAGKPDPKRVNMEKLVFQERFGGRRPPERNLEQDMERQCARPDNEPYLKCCGEEPVKHSDNLEF